MEGFLPDSVFTMIQAPLPTVPKCGLCRLNLSCKSPKMDVSGSGRKGIMIVGEAPGKMEDEFGKQFVGQSGSYLNRCLRSVNIDMRRDCWLQNSLACRPVDNYIVDPRAIEYCRPKVLDAINKHNPSVIILLGKSAVASVIGHLWKEDVGGSKRWAGFQIPSRKPNCWICPTYHPSYIMRETRDAELYNMVFQRHLREAIALVGTRPWDEAPPKPDIDLIYSPSKTAKVLRSMIKWGGTVAFDYETNCLKPDRKEARIVAASVCWEGRKTIAFPWHGEAVDAMRELLRSKVKKISHNAKFEERWTRAKLKTRVYNWHWDSMTAAHALDCRPGITGLKFQSYVRLGQADYDSRIKPYLQSKEPGGNELNRIQEVYLPTLLEYCAQDSYLTYEIAQMQKEELGYDKEKSKIT